MEVPRTIRLLAPTNNARGDLFTRLMKDLFFALGYDGLRLDVHKTGRELDLQGRHRLEPRNVVAECKAHAAKMGGADLNKFFGALTRERKKTKTPVTGYFVSLGGFTESSVEQENDTGDDAVILLGAARVIEELTRNRLLVGISEATERAGHCSNHARLKGIELDGAELLGHELGYLWAVFYAQGKQRTHFALIHADGTPLAESVAEEVVAADRESGGSLHQLHYLAPPPPAPDRAGLTDSALARYRQWLAQECGTIQLDGLPADTDLSATRLKLEKLFVPLKARFLPESDAGGEKPDDDKVHPIGEMLETTPHLALLAAPGGGKSTLLKRLAMAYAFPERRAEAADGLPDRDWLPLFLRCRDLRDRAHRPILELLDDLHRHAGMTADEAVAFRDLVHEALRSDRVVLLVDGLDEISDEGARQTFAQHLRTFLAMFPRAALVVSSREAGFRLVAGVIAGASTRARLAAFEEDDVRHLCESWHVEVIGDTEKVRAEAQELAAAIWANQRIRALAENPLLLTTLLVVKRWIGELPRSRAALYREAVRVLIRTWNVEGFAPLDEDETLTQLSYVASSMMEQGTQVIGHKALLGLLRKARKELDAELQFALISPERFIERIEYRSSLLMQTGHEMTDGGLQPVYEFRHLTFQEYLAARGYVEEQYPGRDEGRSLADLLEPHFEEESWRELIPLAAVLAGRKAEEIVKRLTRVCEALNLEKGYPLETVTDPRVVLLRQCLLDEVQVTPDTLRAALSQAARHGNEEKQAGSVVELRRGKYGALFQEVAENAYLGGGEDWFDMRVAVANLAWEAVFKGQHPSLSKELADSLERDLRNGERVEKLRAAFVCAFSAFGFDRSGVSAEKPEMFALFRPLRDALSRLLDNDDVPIAQEACWALAWIGSNRVVADPPEPMVLRALYRLWRTAESKFLAWLPAWAFSAQPLLPRDTFALEDWGNCESLFQSTETGISNLDGSFRDAALVTAWYRRAPWSDAELATRLKDIEEYVLFRSTAREILKTLGDAGRKVLDAWDKEEKSESPPPS